MKKIFTLGGNFTQKTIDGDVLKIEGYASTKEVDRDGDVILPNAWTLSGGLDNFQKNPIILFNHRRDDPIGRATSLGVDTKGLKITAEISKSAGKVFDIIKAGVLSTFSVGFRIKDAEFREESLGFLITDAELFEISVVSVPSNADSTFSVSKAFSESKDYEEFLGQFKISVDPTGQSSTGAKRDDDTPSQVHKARKEDQSMDEVELKALALTIAETIGKTTRQGIAEDRAHERAEEAAKAAVVAATKAKDEKSEADQKDRDKAVITAAMSGAEILIADLRKSAEDSEEKFNTQIEELTTTIAEKSAEMVKIHESKRLFDDRSGGSKEWAKEFSKDIDDSFILGLACNKSWDETNFGRNLSEKINSWSGTQVSSSTYELAVSTNVERDIQLELVLVPLFREIEMNSASMVFPILPDAGYAEWTTAQVAGGSSPHGNLAERGDTYGSAYGGVDLTEKTVTTKKLISQSYLANETEEDAIIPILPLIRESMIRSHARAMENMILVGNHGDGAFGTSGASPDGLVQIAGAAGLTAQASGSGFAAGDKTTALQLLEARIGLGKYGVKPSDVIYIVSLDTYYNLLEDAEFQDVNLVGALATKVNGQVGTIFGSKVIITDEFATKAADKFHTVAVNTRNYIMPRLRGFTVESDNEVALQRRVLVMSQRIGFDDVITTSSTVSSVFGYQWKGS